LSKHGKFVRWESTFRNWISTDSGAEFPAASGRYHLYVSHACPWAHRTMIYRKLKGLEEHISVSVVHPVMPAESWVFGDYAGSTPDHVHGFQRLADVYEHAHPGFDGVVTVPVLYDKQRGVIVNNESSEIIRMLNSGFDEWGNDKVDLYPVRLRPAIDQINDTIYESINNGVYKTGFATTQQAYELACTDLFDALDSLESKLGAQRFLLGEQPCEADWRLFPTLLRFDPVYVGHFKCNLKRLIDYPNLWGYTRDLYQQPGVAETVNMDHIKTHYYRSHAQLNPDGIVPMGPLLDFMSPHQRLS
jgi:putative glutathione S-transferase